MIEQIPILGVGEVTLEWIVKEDTKLITRYTLQREGVIYDFLGYVPNCRKVIFGRYSANDGEPIEIMKPENVTCVATTLHEIGHARYDSRKSAELLDYDAQINKKILKKDSSITIDDIKGYLQNEYDAWKFAITKLEEMDLPKEAIGYVCRFIFSTNALASHTAFALGGLEIAAKNASITPEEARTKILAEQDLWIQELMKKYDFAVGYRSDSGKGTTCMI